MKINSINNQKYSKHNTSATNAPNFKALYFATPEIQQQVCGRMDFAELLQKKVIKKAIKKYNLVVTDILTKRTFPFLKKQCNGFKFRVCSDVSCENNKVNAVGFKTPEITNVDIYEYGRGEFFYPDALVKISKELKSRTLDIMENKPYFDFLQFRNDDVKEDFQNNPLMRDFLNNIYIRDAISRYNMVILEGNPLEFVACSDISVDKNNEIQPAGFMSHTFTRNHGIAENCYQEGFFGAHLDTLLESTGAEPSRVNKVKTAPKVQDTKNDDWDSVEE